MNTFEVIILTAIVCTILVYANYRIGRLEKKIEKDRIVNISMLQGLDEECDMFDR